MPRAGRLRIQIDIPAGEPGELAPAESGGGDQKPQCVETVAPHLANERAELLGSPHSDARAGCPGRLRVLGVVAGEQIPLDRVTESPVEHAVDVLHRLRGEAAL